MARTTIDLLKDILDDTELSDPILTSYITGANTFVTGVLSGEGLSTALLAEIERWIAAHMIASTRERMAEKEGAGGAEIKYTGGLQIVLFGINQGVTEVKLFNLILMEKINLKVYLI